jgi:hypothetical protein
MNELIFLIFLQSALSYSQPLSSPSGMYVGLKVGMNHCVLDPGERFRNLSGRGFHGGIGIGLDISPYLGINITPQIKSSSYLIGMWPGTDYHYTNLFIPAAVSLKLFSTQSTSPYLGIDGAVTEFGSEREIEDLRNDLYLTVCIGIENKFTRLRISPEFSFNYNLTSNYPDFENLPVSNYDYCLAIGFGCAL